MHKLLLIISLLCTHAVQASSDQEMRDRFVSLYGESAIYEQFYQSLLALIENSDAEQLAKMNSYPLRVRTSKGEQQLGNEADFISHFDEIVTDDLKRSVENQTFARLFANSNGIMIGSGEIWFTGLCIGADPSDPCAMVTVKVVSYDNAIADSAAAGNSSASANRLTGIWRSSHDPYFLEIMDDGTYREGAPENAFNPGSPAEIFSAGSWRYENNVLFRHTEPRGSARGMIDNPDGGETATPIVSTVTWIDSQTIYLGNLIEDYQMEGYDSLEQFAADFALQRVGN